jgi:WD40 repeat protein
MHTQHKSNKTGDLSRVKSTRKPLFSPLRPHQLVGILGPHVPTCQRCLITSMMPPSPSSDPGTLPSLLLHRCEGKVSSSAFCNRLLRKRSRRSLVTTQQILSCSSTSHHLHRRRAAGPVTALDVSAEDGRFLVAGRKDGSIALFDLSQWGGQVGADGRSTLHAPVAQALRAPPISSNDQAGGGEGGDSHRPPQGHRGEVTSARWYPADSGAFLTSSSDGNLLVWDSHEMEPVICYTPFRRYDSAARHRHSSPPTTRGSLLTSAAAPTGQVLGVDSMEVSKRSWHSVAVASRMDASVKLVDIRTGASSHSLVGHERGILCLQWSPSSDFVLASGGIDRSVRIWDVRKSGHRSCLAVLNQHFVPDVTLTKPAQPHYGHLRQAAHDPRLHKSASRLAGTAAQSQATASDRPVGNVAFDPSGNFLATHDGSLAVWDLRDGQGGFQIPRRFVTPHGSVVLSHHGRREGGGAVAAAPLIRPPLCTTDDGAGWSIWTSVGSALAAFSVSGGSMPHQLMKGHISTIQVLAASRDHLVSSGDDGLILLWGHVRDRNQRDGQTRPRIDDTDNW